MADFDKETVTPVHIPKRCISCKQRVDHKRVIVACMCTSCLSDPKNQLGHWLLQEWKRTTPELAGHRGVK